MYFNLYDKIPVEQNITSYRNALTGNLEDNMLSKVYFSKGNIIILQRKLMQVFIVIQKVDLKLVIRMKIH